MPALGLLLQPVVQPLSSARRDDGARSEVPDGNLSRQGPGQCVAECVGRSSIGWMRSLDGMSSLTGGPTAGHPYLRRTETSPRGPHLQGTDDLGDSKKLC